ncbi:MAG TPA: methyltransferase domain-containing protein [Gammaproteobacteria bacterium]|nr:methyltransferase domain-containing protein [Gammaproteobacteria bacterium]
MNTEFDREMRSPDWERVFARQALRVPLLDEWFALLDARPGSRIADLGCGPGFVSLELARRVGPAPAVVYAVDRSADAIDYLRTQAALYGLDHIVPLVADLETLDGLPGEIEAALLAMTVHHASDPVAMLHSAGRLGGEGAPLVVPEFHPDGPATVGPPAGARLAPSTLQAYARQAGLTCTTYRRQTSEHYVCAFLPA